METKHLIFIALTLVFIPSATYAAMASKWIERGLVAGAFLSTAYLVDINFVSLETYRGDTRGFEIGLTDWMILSLLGVMLLSPRWKQRKFTWFPPNSGLLTIYLLVALLSFFVAYVQLYAGFGLMKLLRATVVFIVAYNYIQDEDDLKFIITILAAIVAMEFLFVIEQRFSGIYRAHGTTPHSNTLANYINMINMVFFALLLGQKEKSWLHIVALGMGSLIVLASFSRGAIVAMVLGYGLIVLLSYRHKFSMRKTMILLLLSLLALPVVIKVGPALLERFLYAPEESGESRNYANIAATAMANDHLLGVGLNNYSHVINETNYIRYIDNPVDRGIVHNTFLLHASEMGWLGMLVYLALIFNFVRLGYQSITRSESSLAATLAIGITVAIVVLTLQGSLEWVFRQTYITIEFFMLAGFLVALPKVSRSLKRAQVIHLLQRQLQWKQAHLAYQS